MKYNVLKKVLVLEIITMFVGTVVAPVMGVHILPLTERDSQEVNKEVKKFILETGGENPEIEDRPGDTFGYLDILSAWFFEDPDEPDYLYIAIEIRNLKIRLRTVFSVYWTYDGVKYASTMFVGIYGAYWSISYFDEGWKATGSDGSYDLQTGVITMKIQKSKIGDPQQGDKLANTYALAWQKFIFGWIAWLADFAPDDGYGKDYIIQY